MEKINKFDWKKFENYVTTYDPIKHGGDNSDIIFEDMLYGLGICIDEDNHTWLDGYKRFKEKLLNRIKKQIKSDKNGNS